jgi:hypothetical protein
LTARVTRSSGRDRKIIFARSALFGQRCGQNFLRLLVKLFLFFTFPNTKIVFPIQSALVCKWRQLHEFLFYDLDLFDLVKLIVSIVEKFNGGSSRITDMPDFTAVPIIII